MQYPEKVMLVMQAYERLGYRRPDIEWLLRNKDVNALYDWAIEIFPDLKHD